MTSKELADELGIDPKRVYNAFKRGRVQGWVEQIGSHKYLYLEENLNLKEYKNRIKNDIPYLASQDASNFSITLRNGVEYNGLVGMECALGNQQS